jgi:anti-sigma regulatory factor (Ser/Thr protein kinase)
MSNLVLSSTLSELDKIRGYLENTLKGYEIPENDLFGIELSIQEICVNITRYAYPKGEGKIHLKSWRDEDRLYFEIKDTGIPFNPLEVEEPDIQEMIRTEETGGLGIFLTIKLMDEVTYKRDGDWNVLTMHKEIEGLTKADTPESV